MRTDATIDYQDELVAVIRHDARTLPLEDGTVDLIVTSPPYFALRSYRDDGEHYAGQIGSEDTPDEWLDALDECMVEWGRVLKPSGSVWVNLGDKYASDYRGDACTSGDVRRLKQGPPQSVRRENIGYIGLKSLMGLPWRFAIRQIDNGWILRAEIVWDKPNGLPESVTDRVRRSHEQWFHFVKEPRYFAGVDEIREPHMDVSLARAQRNRHAPDLSQEGVGSPNTLEPAQMNNPLGRLPGSVWRIPSEPLLIPDETRQLLDLPDHFAAFPQEFPRRIILGWSPTGICDECGEGRRPDVERTVMEWRESPTLKARDDTRPEGGYQAASGTMTKAPKVTITGYVCACPTPDAPTTPSIILDPMGGTGTVAGVARMLGRYGISNDLSEDYNRLAIWRITQSGHFAKTEQRIWADRQGVML